MDVINNQEGDVFVELKNEYEDAISVNYTNPTINAYTHFSMIANWMQRSITSMQNNWIHY